jgi:hypothetical protein
VLTGNGREYRARRVLDDPRSAAKAPGIAAQLSAAGHKDAADLVSRHAVRLASGDLSPFW